MSDEIRIHYRCPDVAISIKLLKNFAIDDARFSLSLVATMSPEAMALRERIDSPAGRKEYSDLNVDGLFDAIARKSHRTLPSACPEDLLPEGVRKFVADLDRLIELGNVGRVIPLLEIRYNGEYNHPEFYKKHRVSSWPYPLVSPEKRNTGLFGIFASDLRRKIENILYQPRVQQLEGIGLLAAGHRPGTILFSKMMKKGEIKNAMQALDGVPHNYKIDGFYLGMEPRDHGGREYYDWRCASGFGYMDYDGRITFDFDKGVEDSETHVEEFLKSQCINLERIK